MTHIIEYADLNGEHVLAADLNQLLAFPLIATIVSLTAACQTVSDTSELSNQNKFSIASSANYTLSRSASRQFDIGYGVDFKPTIAKSGTGQYTCEAGFKYAPQNNGLSKADINALGNSPERKQQVRSTLGSLFLKFHRSAR
ncbi:MAG: hypothetical protein U5K75_05655 [Ahrensia sp.]|nr:hypothetical protein [Ahrensia sp.]